MTCSIIVWEVATFEQRLSCAPPNQQLWFTLYMSLLHPKGGRQFDGPRCGGRLRSLAECGGLSAEGDLEPVQMAQLSSQTFCKLDAHMQDNAKTMKVQLDAQKKATDQLVSNTRWLVDL